MKCLNCAPFLPIYCFRLPRNARGGDRLDSIARDDMYALDNTRPVGARDDRFCDCLARKDDEVGDVAPCEAVITYTNDLGAFGCADLERES